MLMKGAVLGGAAFKAKIAAKAAKVAAGTAKVAVGTAKVAVGTAKAAVGTATAAVGTGVAAGVAAGVAVAETEKKLAVSGLGLAASKLAGIPSQILNTSGSYKAFITAQVEDPILTCGEGFALNLTALGQAACVKQGALVKATKFPIALPAAAAALGIKALQHELGLPSNTSITKLVEDELDMLDPLKAVKAVSALSAAGSEVAQSLMSGASPMELVVKSLLNLNITEVMAAEPQIMAWVADMLVGVNNAANITISMKEYIPNCLFRCCSSDVAIDTTVSLATTGCAAGLRYNSFLGVCTGQGARWDDCPKGATTCTLPLGFPVCVASSETLGLNSCKVMTMLGGVLPRVQCNSTVG
eukprot:gene4112-4358_t